MQEIRRFKPSTVSRKFSVTAGFYRTCVLDGIMEHSIACPASRTGGGCCGQDRILQNGKPAGHDNETCTVSFGRDVLCQDIIILTGQGDLRASWTIQWPAAGTRGPASFDGVIDGGTAHFAAAHGTFHAATLPDGDMQITAEIGAGY
jgi:hypothetical protein